VELLLVRHGVTQYNTDRIFMGHGPVPLSATGREQVERLAERLSVDPPARILSSDIVRARQSAEIIAAKLGLAFATHAELREVDVGAARGLSYAEAARRWPGIFSPEGEERFPDGESFAEVADRATDFLRAAVFGGVGRTLVVTHGGVVRGAAARLLRLPLASVADFVIDNASLTLFRAEGDVVQLVTWNDTAHLGRRSVAAGWPGVGG
jgi:probable phosphoglycerate mutase